jgi:3D (Asp-Asp-Asp) domain-containing protein
MLFISFTAFSQHTLRATKYYPNYKGMGTITASGSKVNINSLRKGYVRWVALSQDMFKYYKFNDIIYVQCSNKHLNGFWIVKDKMNKRIKRGIDFMLHREEHIGFNTPIKVKIIKVTNTFK